jgi:hypothetical protein
MRVNTGHPSKPSTCACLISGIPISSLTSHEGLNPCQWPVCQKRFRECALVRLTRSKPFIRKARSAEGKKRPAQHQSLGFSVSMVRATLAFASSRSKREGQFLTAFALGK